MTTSSGAHLRARIVTHSPSCRAARRRFTFFTSPPSRASPRRFRASASHEDEYNAAMMAYSATPYEYKHDAGLYYHKILNRLYVGTQLVKVNDVDRLRDVEGVTCVFNTQRDEDAEYWKVDVEAIRARIAARSMKLERYPFVDFDGDSLRQGLPRAAAALAALISSGEVVYCHCTAGMGRSPGVAIAYMYWFLDDYATLDEAYEGLTKIRPCGPKKESIRAATCDVLAAKEGERPTALARALGANEGAALTREEKESIRRKLRRCF